MKIRYKPEQFLGKTRYVVSITDDSGTFSIFTGKIQSCKCGRYITDKSKLATFGGLSDTDGNPVPIGWDWHHLTNTLNRWLLSLGVQATVEHSTGHDCQECAAKATKQVNPQ